MVTPEEWLANFEAKVAEVRQKTAEFKQNLEASGVTETSADGALRVTVAPNGALTGLSIDDAAMRNSGGELAGQIMRLAHRARRAAAVNVAAAFGPLAGVDSAPVTGHPSGEDEPASPATTSGPASTDVHREPEPSPRSGEPPARTTRGARPRGGGAADDPGDEEFGADQIFGRRDEW